MSEVLTFFIDSIVKLLNSHLLFLKQKNRLLKKDDYVIYTF
jgi:hypothetical protein